MIPLNFLETGFFNNINKNLSKTAIHKSVSIVNEKLLKNIDEFQFAIIGFPHDSESRNIGCAKAPNSIRESLYSLEKPFESLKILDFGNIKSSAGNNVDKNLTSLINLLIGHKIFPIILGGNSNLLHSVYQAFKSNNKLVNISSIDARIDISESGENSYLSKIFTEENNTVFNFTNIGYQSYYVSSAQLNKLDSLNYDAIRLGAVRSNLLSIEPSLRDTNILNLNINSIKQTDAPANSQPSPNGLYSEEICQIAKYAGFSDSINAFCLTELNPDFDNHNQTVNLAGQILWYFIDGYKNRIIENPLKDKNGFVKFHIQPESYDIQLEFYKSNKTGRWWLQLPVNSNLISNQKHLLACSLSDYTNASNNEIPDRIWKYYKKLL